jgi:transglutaminase-like putative cysteine protease
VAVALFTVLTEMWFLGAVLSLAVLGSLAPVTWPVDKLGQVALALVSLFGTWLLTIYVGPLLGKPHEIGALGMLGWIVAVGSFLVAVPRYYMAAPMLGERGNAGVSLLAVAACGDTRLGSVYLVFVVVFLAVQIMAISKSDRGRPAWSRLTKKHYLVMGLGLPAAGVITAGLVIGLPLFHDWTINRLTPSFIDQSTGFSTRLQLGTLDGMYQSDVVVMRVKGPKPGLLRGIVYSKYANGSFFVDRFARPVRITLPNNHRNRNRVTNIQVVTGDRDRYFLPLRARAIRIEKKRLFADSTGIVTAEEGDADQVWFASGPRDRVLVAKPGVRDLKVPGKLKNRLGVLASRWIENANSDEAKLAALETRLRSDFDYSFHFRRTRGIDPVLDFLTTSKKGHCEYFAAAMVLLSRSVGIPARVVGGYRVGEINPLGGYYIVRERNAHAWVEAWVAGTGWKTYDPTPAIEIAGNTSAPLGGVAAVVDLMKMKWTDGMRWLAKRTPMQFSIAVAALFLVWLTVRKIRKMREKKKRSADELPLFADPHPVFVSLLEHLAARGIVVTTGEALESLAERIAGAQELGGNGARASELIHRYAAWRYGEQGDMKAVSQDIETWIHRA